MDNQDTPESKSSLKCVECGKIITENAGTPEIPVCENCHKRLMTEYEKVSLIKKNTQLRTTILCPSCNKEALPFWKAYLLAPFHFRCESCGVMLKWYKPIISYTFYLLFNLFSFAYTIICLYFNDYGRAIVFLAFSQVFFYVMLNIFGKIKLVEDKKDISKPNSVV
jgi:DNA-directed RNA polymerase subunit RPC12/RpoP